MRDQSRVVLFLLTVCVLIGFALRLYQLDAVPLRGDEAFSASYWAGLPLAQSLSEIATIEPHPPLTYALFRGWGLLFSIDHPLVLRLLSVLLNLLGIPAMYALGKRLGNQWIGLIAAFLWALHPFQIWHAQDFRNYGLWAGLSAVALWLGLRVITLRKRTDWALYALIAMITALIFYNELLTLAVLSLYAVITQWQGRRFMMRWLGVQGVIVAVTLLAFLILQGNLIGSGAYTGTTGGFVPEQWLTWFLPALNFGDTLPGELISLLWPALVVFLLWVCFLTWRINRNLAIFCMLLAFVPPLLLGIVSVKLHIFRPRYVLSAVPAYLLLTAACAVFLWRWCNSAGRILAVGFIAGWVFVDAFSLYSYWAGPPKAQNWPLLADYLATNVQPDELVIQTSTDAAFGYYYHAPADEMALPENPEQPIPEIIATLEQVSSEYPALWIVGRTFSDWPNTGIVEQWAIENMQLVRETSAAGLPVRQFMTWAVSTDEISTEPIAVFEEKAALVGYRIFETPEPTGELTVWLYWRALDTTAAPFKIFVHLIGDINPLTNTPLWSQDDQEPQNARISTTSWTVNLVYRDSFHLPVGNVPAGKYLIAVGLYNPVDNTRLLTTAAQDHVVLGTIQLGE